MMRPPLPLVLLVGACAGSVGGQGLVRPEPIYVSENSLVGGEMSRLAECIKRATPDTTVLFGRGPSPEGASVMLYGVPSGIGYRIEVKGPAARTQEAGNGVQAVVLRCAGLSTPQAGSR